MRKGYKEPSRTVKLRVNIENAINEAEKYSNMTRDDICKSMNFCNSTLWSRLKDPDKFTLGELRVIAMLSGRKYPEFLSEIVK